MMHFELTVIVNFRVCLLKVLPASSAVTETSWVSYSQGMAAP